MYNISDFFKKIEWAIKEKRITELNIQNIDKTSFQISYKKVKLVITIDLTKQFSIIDSKNYAYITSVECISFIGKNHLTYITNFQSQYFITIV